MNSTRPNLPRRRIAQQGLSLGATSIFGAGALFASNAQAQLSQVDATSGIKAALQKGADVAVSKLGVTDGFLLNPKVRIPLPPTLKKIRGAAKMLGMDGQFEQLEASMNRAAEAAVPLAKPLLTNAVKQMSVQDAMGILKGGDDSVTNYFKSKTGATLVKQFLPIATQATSKVGLAQQYEKLASQGSKLGLVKEDQKSLDGYIAQKAVDGLFLMIAEEEKGLRANPMAAGSAILQKVFGALK